MRPQKRCHNQLEQVLLTRSAFAHLCDTSPHAQALQQEHEGLLADAAAREAALAELDAAVAAAEGELGRNPAKRRTLELQVGNCNAPMPSCRHAAFMPPCGLHAAMQPCGHVAMWPCGYAALPLRAHVPPPLVGACSSRTRRRAKTVEPGASVHGQLPALCCGRQLAGAQVDDESVIAATLMHGRPPFALHKVLARWRALPFVCAHPQEAVRQLQQQHADLAAAEDRAKATPEEQREALMSKARGRWAPLWALHTPQTLPPCGA
jgi:hypothetical protein